jgi:hypothetical protein
MTRLKPFSKASSTTIGGMTVETDEDSLVLSGSMDARRDAGSLKGLEALSSILLGAIEVLKASKLPDAAPGDLPPGPTIANPFA